MICIILQYHNPGTITIICHSYTKKPMSRVGIIDGECTNNVQSGGLQVSTSNRLIVMEEDGSGCQQLPVSTIGSGHSVSWIVSHARSNQYDITPAVNRLIYIKSC